MEFINQFKNNWRMFLDGGYKDVYRLIFGAPQFPIFSTVQAAFSCFVVHRSFIEKKRSFTLELRKLIISFLMTFASRELFAYVFKKQSPLQHYPMTLAIFFAVYVLMNFFPGDLVYKLCSGLYYFVGLANGFNQVRYFTLALRQVKKFPEFAGPRGLPVAIMFAAFDQVIEAILRPLFKGDDSKISNVGSVIKTGLAMSVYWCSTNHNYFSKWVPLRDQQMAALVLGLGLGMISTFGKVTSDAIKANQAKAKKEEPKVEEVQEEEPKATGKTTTARSAKSELDAMKNEIKDLKAQIQLLKQEMQVLKAQYKK